MGSLLRQLELTTIGLMNLLDARLVIRRAVGRDSVVEGSTAAHDVNFVIDDIVPNGGEVLQQLGLACLGV